MELPYTDILGFVQQLTPTWGKHQHRNFARLVTALLEKGGLNLCDIARVAPLPTQPLHGRLKRLDRFLDNPRLDEAALFLRFFNLAYRFGEDLPRLDGQRHALPLLFDTVYFEPMAMLVTTIPCGSRGLPIALTTYHRTKLEACFPPETNWPQGIDRTMPPRRRRHKPVVAASAVLADYDSQNKIEEHMLDYVFHLVSPALRGITVADAGFARASLFQHHYDRNRDFAIRFDSATHIRLPEPLTPGRPTQGPSPQVLGLQPGQRLWCPQAWYGKDDQIPISILALWDLGYEKPWYIAANATYANHSGRDQEIETIYRWRMRLECANRDEKTGVILREGGDQHGLRSILHLHRLLLALCTAEWLLALTGLQAWHDLPREIPVATVPCQPVASAEMASAAPGDTPSSPASAPPTEPMLLVGDVEQTQGTKEDKESTEASVGESDPDEGPASPPPIVPHRGPRPKLPSWMKRFAAWGPLSYVRLGFEVLCAPDLQSVVKRMVGWLTNHLWVWTPPWRPWQLRYRRRNWWSDSPYRNGQKGPTGLRSPP